MFVYERGIKKGYHSGFHGQNQAGSNDLLNPKYALESKNLHLMHSDKDYHPLW